MATDKDIIESVSQLITESEQRIKDYIDRSNASQNNAQRADLAVILEEWRIVQEETVQSFFRSWNMPVPVKLTMRTSRIVC